MRSGPVLMLARAAVVVVVVVLGWAAPGGAHPLGNFTVNRYARLEVSSGVLRVHYVYDAAEIPAFQQREEVGADPEGFARRRAAEIGAGLQLTVDGRPSPLEVVGHDLSQPEGQGGLPTLRLAVSYAASLPPGEEAHRATFADLNEPSRIGWREVVVVARGNGRITSSDAPRQDVSDELRAYPTDLLEAPLDRRRATFTFVAGTITEPPPALTGASPRAPGGFPGLVAGDRASLPVLAGLLLLAVGFGAVHALGPGHGKTVMAAYLVGTKGRARDAVALGGVVSLMHTASVLVLGLALFRLNRSASAERVYPWLTLASGAVVTAVGASLLATRWRSRSQGAAGSAHDHRHNHPHIGRTGPGDGHATSEAGGHDGPGHRHGHEGHDHHELAPGVAPLSRRGLLLLGASGGLFPSPSAVVVVISAFALGRAGLGLALIGAFSIGLAATLTAVGLALVYGRGVVERRLAGRLFGYLPVGGALALVVVGLVILSRGIDGLA